MTAEPHSYRGRFRIGDTPGPGSADDQGPPIGAPDRRSARSTCWLVLSILAGGLFAMGVAWLMVRILPPRAGSVFEPAPYERQAAAASDFAAQSTRDRKPPAAAAPRRAPRRSMTHPDDAGHGGQTPAVIYRWTDPHGTRHFSDRPASQR
jgi:hypothetical protein